MKKTLPCLLLLLPCFAFSGTSFRLLEKVASRHLSFPRNVIVHLPPDYATSGKRYPVLYAHDGQNLFDRKTAFAGEWELDENIAALQKAGLLDGIIVVGIYNNASRIEEYTPTYIKPGASEWLKHGGGGKLRAYGRFITEELKPMIDKQFRTLPDRRNTGVMGSSLGGIASFYLLGWYPQVFSKAGCISPSFWWDDQTVLRDLPGLRFPADVKIYIDGGWKEGADESSMVKWMRLVKSGLNRKGLRDLDNIFYHEDPFGTHSEGAWARRGRWPLLYLFGKFVPQVEKVTLGISPATIGVGDTSAPFAQALLANGMPFTLFDGFRIGAGSAALQPDGRLLGRSAGSAALSLSFRGRTYTEQFTVLPEGRNSVALTLELSGGDGPYTLELKKADGSWESRPFTMQPSGKGTIVLKGQAGEAQQIRFRNGKGLYAATPAGALLAPRLTLTGSQIIRIMVKKWIKQ